MSGLSGMFYGTGKLEGLKDAVTRRARTGAGIGGLGYLLRWGNDGRKEKRSDAKNLRDFGKYIEALKRSGRNDAKFPWKELVEMVMYFKEGW